MYDVLDRVALASGELMEIGVVTCPEAAWRDRVLTLLGHKGPHWRAHAEGALDGALEGLATWFYLGSLDGQPIGVMMVAGAGGAGVFGHVYTVPQYRRRGASKALMARQMAHTRAAGMRVLTLGADPRGHARRMYAGFGFADLPGLPGLMIWEAEPGAVAALITGAPGAVRPLRWSDYGVLAMLATLPVGAAEEMPRSPTLGLHGVGSVESGFVTLQYRRQYEPWAGITALVLPADGGGTPLGWAVLAPDERWFGELLALDLYVCPACPAALEGYRRLLAALPATDEPVVCATCGAGPRATALGEAGFSVRATLPSWLPPADGTGWRDVQLYRRG